MENNKKLNCDTARTETLDNSSMKFSHRSMDLNNFNGIEQAFQIFIEKKQKSETNGANFLLNNRNINPTSAKSMFK